MRKTVTFIAILTSIVGCETASHQIKCGANRFGSGVSKSVGSVSKKIVSEQKKANCKEDNANALFVANVIPQTVYQGNSAVATICYPVTVAEGATIDVTETRELMMPNGSELVLSQETYQRDKGYWDSEFTFNVPADADIGDYTMTQRISYGEIVLEKNFDLEVRKTYQECQ